MKKETKSDLKSGAATGAGAAVGAVAGVIAGDALAAETAGAAEIETPENAGTSGHAGGSDTYGMEGGVAAGAATAAGTGHASGAQSGNTGAQPGNAGTQSGNAGAQSVNDGMAAGNAGAATENAVETDYAAEAGMTVEAEAGEDVSPATGGASAGEDDGSQVTVVGYETMDMEGGGQMDVAVVEVDGLQGVVADIDMDGSADIVAIDANDDGRLGEDEFLDVSGQGIDMASLGGEMQVSGEPLVAEVPASQYDAVADPQDGSQTGFQADAGGALPDDGQQAGDLQGNILQTDDLQDNYADVAFNDVYEDAPLDYVNDADVGDYMA